MSESIRGISPEDIAELSKSAQMIEREVKQKGDIQIDMQSYIETLDKFVKILDTEGDTEKGRHIKATGKDMLEELEEVLIQDNLEVPINIATYRKVFRE